LFPVSTTRFSSRAVSLKMAPPSPEKFLLLNTAFPLRSVMSFNVSFALKTSKIRSIPSASMMTVPVDPLRLIVSGVVILPSTLVPTSRSPVTV
jgi:hypothetical protein